MVTLGGFRWAAHVMRMEESDPDKKVLFAKPGGRGDRRGSPKLRRDVFKHLARVGCRNWGINVQ